MKYLYKFINPTIKGENSRYYDLEQPSEYKFVGVVGQSLILEKIIEDDKNEEENKQYEKRENILE